MSINNIVGGLKNLKSYFRKIIRRVSKLIYISKRSNYFILLRSINRSSSNYSIIFYGVD